MDKQVAPLYSLGVCKTYKLLHNTLVAKVLQQIFFIVVFTQFRTVAVGALIVKDKMIISDGYNGTPSGFENVCEDENNVTKPYVLHAEANAITKIARSNNSSNGATMYVTASPCIECAKLIIQAGIKRVVYSEKYRLEDGIELLKRAGIEVVFISMDNG